MILLNINNNMALGCFLIFEYKFLSNNINYYKFRGGILGNKRDSISVNL